MSDKYIYQQDGSIKKWIEKKFGRPDHWNTDSEKEHQNVEQAYLDHVDSLPSIPAKTLQGYKEGDVLVENIDFYFGEEHIYDHKTHKTTTPIALPLKKEENNSEKPEEIIGFTAGPWKLRHSLKGQELHVLIHAKDLSSTTDRDLQVLSFNDQHPVKEHLLRRLADARLIASAPTMYAELKSLQEENERYRNLIERAAKANVGRPSELIEQFEQFQKECIKAINQK